MKKFTITTILFFMAMMTISAQNGELTTLRIGGFKYQMSLKEVKEISEKPLYNVKNEYDADSKMATYKGQKILLEGINMYEGAIESDLKVYSLSTKSPLFKTKSGLGVGSTKEQLFQTYKDYPNFSVGQRWDMKTEKISTSETYFSLEDTTTGTTLQFILKDNIVTEVMVYMEEN